MARQPYYRLLAAPATDTELAAAYRANALFDAHRDDPEFGHRFLADEARAAGEPMTERTAWKISRGNRWWSTFRKRRGRGKSAKADPPVSAHVSSERRASRCRLHQEAIVDHLFTVMGEAATPIARTGLAAEGLLERQHLQEWVIAHPQVLGESVLVVTAEYDRWADTDGVPARDRLDVLGLDATGRLVVVELKRGTADRDVHLQAITYAALVSRFDLSTLTQAHRDFLSRRGQNLDFDTCRQRLLDHVDGQWSPELLQRPRQVIIAADFPKQVTHSVVWLSEMSLDIDLIQVGLWKVKGHVVAGFTKVYPTPEVEEFTLAPARVEGEAAAKKLQERARSRNAVHVLVGAGLLPEGTKLLMTPRHGATEAIRNAINAWVEEDGSRATAVWTNNTAQPLIWDADGASYSPTGLANHIFTSVTSRTADGIQGTTWWDVDTSQVPSDVDSEEWATLAGLNLSGLAKQLNGTRKDWTELHTLLGAVPAGRWTTYGDVAVVIGSHAVPVGRHLSTCGQCPSPWRVLNAAGRVSNGFQWADHTRTDTPAEILGTEGVRFNGAVADADKRLGPDALRQLLDI